MKKYTTETLKKENHIFNNNYGIDSYDVAKVNTLIETINKTRTKTPQPGDVVEYINEYGEYFSHAHIETIEDGEIYLCEQAGTNISIDKEGQIYFSSSGGTWKYISVSELSYVGKAERKFWTFGHKGACSNGGLYFNAKVNLWRCNLNKKPFSTKTHEKYYLSFSNLTKNYHYFASKSGMSSNAWKTMEELQAWLRTHRAIINGNVAWCYKEINHHVSPKQYEQIESEEDIFLMNGSKRRCKRIYDENKFEMHTYFVWYWGKEELDEHDYYANFDEIMSYQNKEINKYVVDYFSNNVNIIALEELKNGMVKPIHIDFN